MKITITERVKLEYNTELVDKEFIPASAPYLDNIENVERIACAINENIPVLLVGDTGTGKTSLIRHLAERTGNAFRRVNHTGGTDVSDIKGKILLPDGTTKWIDGVLLDAMRKGHWYLADEINASGAEILFLYHSLLDDDGYIVLDENNGEVVRPHKNFRFFATMNDRYDYVGTREMNKALLSRFAVIRLDYPTPGIEVQILQTRTGLNKTVAKRFVNVANDLRRAYADNKITLPVSTRDLIQWSKLFNVFNEYVNTAEVAIVNKADNTARQSVRDIINVSVAKYDEKNAPVEVITDAQAPSDNV
jgi:midasin (ATPase involved in ribosome maturation)